MSGTIFRGSTDNCNSFSCNRAVQDCSAECQCDPDICTNWLLINPQPANPLFNMDPLLAQVLQALVDNQAATVQQQQHPMP